MGWVIAVLLVALLAVAGYAHWPISPLPDAARADRLLVLKGERRLILFKDGVAIRDYRIALGRNPLGPKAEEGDGRTPEGGYVIDYRKPDSDFHRALHISYPSPADQAAAAARGVDAGGQIMIHGIRNGQGIMGRWHRMRDWTAGCIALTDAEIEQIWQAVPDGTPIEIRP